MDDQFEQLVADAPQLSAAVAEKIRRHIELETDPVKPMLHPGLLALIISGLAALVAASYALLRGWQGLQILTRSTAATLLVVLSLFTLFAGAMVARSMRPAAGRLHTWLLSAAVLVAYEGLVMALFRDSGTELFLQRGLACLATGVSCGAVTALLVWLVMRRGLVVDPVAAGALTGLLGGLAGVLALTLHCPVVAMPHAAVWHTGVFIVCLFLGALGGFLRRGRKAS